MGLLNSWLIQLLGSFNVARAAQNLLGYTAAHPGKSQYFMAVIEHH